MALQWTRVPAFRSWVLTAAESIHHAQLLKDLESRRSWEAALLAAGIPADSPGADYERSLEFVRSKRYTISYDTAWYMHRALKAAERIAPLLRERHWEAGVSETGSFIGSDTPVVFDGPKGRTIGFKDAEVVIHSISRHVILLGTSVPITPPVMTRRYIAHSNTFTMIRADSQVYSHVPDFCWQDQANKYQTDWHLFSREKF